MVLYRKLAIWQKALVPFSAYEFYIWQNYIVKSYHLWNVAQTMAPTSLVYSYHTEAKLRRTKRSQKFCASMAACPVTVCMCTCQSVCQCVFVRVLYTPAYAAMFIQCVHAANCFIRQGQCQPLCVRGETADRCLPALLTVVTTVCSQALLGCTATHLSTWRDMNGRNTMKLTDTSWQPESETTWWASVFTPNPIVSYVLNGVHLPPSDLACHNRITECPVLLKYKYYWFSLQTLLSLDGLKRYYSWIISTSDEHQLPVCITLKFCCETNIKLKVLREILQGEGMKYLPVLTRQRSRKEGEHVNRCIVSLNVKLFKPVNLLGQFWTY